MNLKWGIVVVVLCLMIGGVNAATFSDTFQNHPSNDPTDLWHHTHWNHGSGSMSILEYGATYSNLLKCYGTSPGGYMPSYNYFRTNVSRESLYWSFVVRYYYYTAGSRPDGHHQRVYLQFLDKNLNQIGNYDILSYVHSYQASDLFEIQIVAGNTYLIINGVSMGALGTCSGNPSYLRFYTEHSGGRYTSPGGADYYSTGYIYLYIDDVTTEKGVVGVGAEPCVTGVFETHSITELNTYPLSASWHVTAFDESAYTDAQYDIKVRRATWSTIYNTSRLKNAGVAATVIKPEGVMVYNWSELFNVDHYGLYWFEVYKTASGAPELVGQDFLYFQDVGEPSTINIEETEYAIGETMNISYYIDSPDFGANQYKIQIFDSTGQLKDTRVLTQQAATEQITSTIDWEEGLLYAVLVKDTKPAITEDPPEDIIDLAYDFCTLSNVIYITGKVWDASNSDSLVDGTLLDNVSLNWTQAGTIYNTTSDGAGRYEFTDPTTLLEIEWFQDVPITVHAEKTGYTHDDFTMTIIKAGRYTVDIYLVPTPNPYSKTISGLVADDIFHQAIPYAEVNLWNGVSNTTYTNLWGYYETCTIPNGTYRMQAEKETFRTSDVVIVNTDNISLSLDDCDECNYNEAVLDACDAVTGWSSDNTLTLNTTDYVEGTGALQSYGYNATDYYKTFSPAIDANVSEAHGYFYFYSKIDNVTNISSDNVTVKISSNATGATDLFIWNLNKSSFNTSWDLYMLKITNATEIGNCNLTNISYFRWESTKSDNVTTKIDGLAFIEYAGWDSCVDLSVDTSDKQEGTGSLKADGLLRSYCNLAVGVPFSPVFNAGTIGKTSDLSRLLYWRKHTNNYTHIESVCLVDSDGDTLCWQTDISGLTWQKQELFLKSATETGDFNTNAISYLSIYDLPQPITIRYDDILLIQSGQVQQNFYLSQYFELTVRAKDADTHYTITDFTAILDTTNVKETTTGTIVFTNITYAIYPLEVSSAGYYTNKQYVFMGQDTEQLVYLTKIENVSSGGAGTYYPPRAVEFKVQTLWGNAVDDVTVNVTALETSGSSWDWLWSVMGLSQDVSSEIENASMNGTTDSLGRISFMMVETVKYRVQFTKPSESVNTTITVYPKDTHYVIIVGTKGFTRDTEWYEAVNFTVTWSEINNTHGYINMSYNDTFNETLSLLLYINNSDDSLVWNQSYSSGCNQTNAQIEVNKTGGKAFYVGFSADHITFGHSPLDWEQVLKFKWFLDVGIPHDACKYASVAFLVLFACFFGATTVEMGSVFVSMFAWIFHFIGWLEVRDAPTTYLVLTIITTIAVLAYIAARSRRVYRN